MSLNDYFVCRKSKIFLWTKARHVLRTVRAYHDSSVYAKKVKLSWKYWLLRSIVVKVVKHFHTTVGIKPVPVRCRYTALTTTKGRALLLYCSTSIIWYKMNLSANNIFNGNYNELHWNLEHLHQTDTSKCDSVKSSLPRFSVAVLIEKIIGAVIQDNCRYHWNYLLDKQHWNGGGGSIGPIVMPLTVASRIFALFLYLVRFFMHVQNLMSRKRSI